MTDKDPSSQTASVGRPARITREDIASTALAIGLDKFTLSAIGSALGVDHSSLYRHIKSRDDILIAAADLAVANADWHIETDSWRTFVLHVAETSWALYQRHPGLAAIMRRVDSMPPSIIRIFAQSCRELERFGFSLADAALLIDSIMDMTSDSSLGWQHMAEPIKNGMTVAQSLQSSLGTMAEESPDLAHHIIFIEEVINNGPHNWWKRKLELLLDGAEKML
nr:TetR/AcrR family transcriptional regulator C-terminal domain-containing protein [uncultured Cohaesibacter sp.]